MNYHKPFRVIFIFNDSNFIGFVIVDDRWPVLTTAFDNVLFFVTSDTYEVGLPEEVYQLSYVPDSSNPTYNSFINGPQDYLESTNNIYIRFPDSPIELLATKVTGSNIWQFDYFNTQYFLNKLVSCMSLYSDVNDIGFILYNGAGNAIQRIPFPLVYKHDFPIQE